MFNPEHTINLPEKKEGSKGETVLRLLERLPVDEANRYLEKLEENGLTEKVKGDVPTLMAIGAVARKVRGPEAAKNLLEKLYSE